MSRRIISDTNYEFVAVDVLAANLDVVVYVGDYADWLLLLSLLLSYSDTRRNTAASAT